MTRSARWTSESPHQALRVALASASLLSMTAAPLIAHADGLATDATPSTSGVYVTILSPNPGTSLTGAKHIEISAYYESSFGVSAVDLFIDGRRMATQKLDSPENRGEISFVVDPASLRGGAHTIVVRATATDAEVASARTSLTLPAGGAYKPEAQLPSSDSLPAASSGAADVEGAPRIDIVSPGSESNVEGTVRIKVNAIDPSGKSPYVSLFVDHAFKTLRNYPPYTFDWDTTRLANGEHTIEVWGYNDAQQVGHANPLKVIVNNPGGRTFERHDLLDSAPSVAVSAPARKARAAKAAPRIAAIPAAKTLPRPAALAPSVARAAKPAVTAAQTPAPAAKAAPPIIAHAAPSAVSQLIAKAATLASINTDAAPLGAVDVDETLIAPVLAEHQVPHLVPAAEIKTAPKLSATHKIVDTAGPQIAHAASVATTEMPGVAAKLEQIASASLTDLDSGDISAVIAAPGVKEREVPHLVTMKDMQVPRLVPMSVIARQSSVSVGAPVLADSSPGVSRTRGLDLVGGKLVQIASANIDSSGLDSGSEQLSAPQIKIAPVRALAAKLGATIAKHRVTLASFTQQLKSRITGTRQMVIDDQRVSLDRPLASKGSILFAPFRKIFESEGGQLAWDNAKQQVHAVSPERDILVQIGSKTAHVNSKAVDMSAAPYLDNNRTMLPLDFFPMAMDVHITYDAATGHLVMESR